MAQNSMLTWALTAKAAGTSSMGPVAHRKACLGPLCCADVFPGGGGGPDAGIDSQRPREDRKKIRSEAESRRESAAGSGNPNPGQEGDPSIPPPRRLRLVTSRTAMAAPSPSPAEAAPQLGAADADEEDEWDADGYVVPNLLTQDNDVIEPSIPAAKDPEPLQAKDEKIYLGPHGAPPSQVKQQELNTAGRKQRFRNKLKEADRKLTGNAQENKVESLRELMGARASGTSIPRSSPRDWLDPHCHESEFDRKPTR